MLLNWDGFACKQRLVSLQITTGQEDGISRNPIAFGRDDDVATHHLAARNTFADPAPDHQRPRTCQISQRFENPLSPVFLNDRNRNGCDCGTDQHQRFANVTEHEVNGAGGEQELEHGLAADFDRDPQQVASSRSRQFVIPF